MSLSRHNIGNSCRVIFLSFFLFFLFPRVSFAKHYTSKVIPSTYENYGTPQDMITLPNGDMWYADSENYRIVKISTTGEILRTVGRQGTGDGEFSDTLSSITKDSQGNLYVLDYCKVYKLDFNGGFIKSWGSCGDTAYSSEMSGGAAIHYSSYENLLLVTDSNHNRVVKYSLNGDYLSEFGTTCEYNTPGDLYSQCKESPVPLGQFNQMSGITTDSSGKIYVIDLNNHRVQVFTSTGVPSFTFGGSASGNYQFVFPKDVEILSNGDIVVTSQNAQRIKKFSSTGVHILSWGENGTGEQQFATPQFLTRANDNSIWVSDFSQKKFLHFSNTGTFIERIGNNGSTAGKFTNPNSAAFDSLGNIYILDTTHRVQKFDSNGTYMSTIISSGIGSGSYHIAISPITQNIFVSEETKVNMFSSDGTYINSLGNRGVNGPNFGSGDFNNARGMTFDSIGNIYVADYTNHRVQKFNPALIANENGGFMLEKSFLPTGVTWKSEWQAGGTTYAVFNGVWYNGDYYISKQNGNFNHTPAEDAWWTIWSPGSEDNWNVDTSYNQYTTVIYEDSRYISTQNENVGKIPSDLVGWGLVVDNGDWVSSGTTYTNSDAVIYGGLTYISIQNGNNGHLPTDTDWWSLWNAAGNGEIQQPDHVVIEAGGNLLVSSSLSSGNILKIQKYNASTGVWMSTYLNKYNQDAFDGESYNQINGLSMDTSGKLYVSDPNWEHVLVYNADGSLSEAFGSAGSSDDQYDRASAARVNPVTGDIVVVDQDNHRVQILENGVKIKNLTPSADVLNVSNNLSLVKKTVNPDSSSNLTAELYFGDYLVSDFSVDLSADRDWAAVNAVVLPDQSRSLIVNLNQVNAPGVSATHSLYIAKQVGQTYVVVCPNATAIDDVSSGCTGSYTLNEGDANLSVVTIDSQEYWKVGGLTGTGGFSPVVKTFNMGSSSSNIKVGEEIGIEVTAKDDNGLVDNSYRGTVHFSAVPGTATLPADYAFTASDNGVHSFGSISFSQAGTYEVVIADTVDSERSQAITIVVTSLNSGSNNNSSSSSSSSSSSNNSGTATCDNQKPGNLAPYIWKTESLGNGKVRLYFNDAERPTTDYHLVFGIKSGKYIYGGIKVASYGDKSLIVSKLKLNTKYYFKLIPYNGCASGNWSNEVSVKTVGKYSIFTSMINNLVIKKVNPILAKTNLPSVVVQTIQNTNNIPNSDPVVIKQENAKQNKKCFLFWCW